MSVKNWICWRQLTDISYNCLWNPSILPFLTWFTNPLFSPPPPIFILWKHCLQRKLDDANNLLLRKNKEFDETLDSLQVHSVQILDSLQVHSVQILDSLQVYSVQILDSLQVQSIQILDSLQVHCVQILDSLQVHSVQILDSLQVHSVRVWNLEVVSEPP